ncbi:MAG: ABC transporter ATP-binding protein [Nanoarchaeota archaeon]
MKKSKKRGIIKLENVHKHYRMGDEIVKAVNGIDIEINQGDFVAIMGPSGSGKSTTMNLIGSLDTPTSGKIFLDNKNIAELSESDLAQIRGKKIGFIFQQFNLIPNLTAKENIMMPMLFQDFAQEQREKRAEELLKMVDIADRKDHYPNQLSGGQQQRVAIARSLSNNPEVILADEPTGNLDTKTGENVLTFLNKLHRKGKTIIMVTHDPKLAKEHSEKVYWLVDGKIKKITKEKRKRI